jgi:hypothetical protein
MRDEIEKLAARWREEAVDSMPDPAALKTLVRCARELEAILAAGEGGWRSMDSAPRDGTFVLLWVPADERSDGYCEVGSWVRSAGYWDIGTSHQPDSMFTHWHAEPPPPPQEPPR